MAKFTITTKEVKASVIFLTLVIISDLIQHELTDMGIVPLNTQVFLQFSVLVITLAAAMYGPMVGLIVAVSSSLILDYYFYGAIDIVALSADAIFGVGVGFFADKYAVLKGDFTGIKLLDLSVVLLMMNIFCSILFAPLAIFLLLNGDLMEIISTGVTAAITNSLVTIVIATPILYLTSRLIKRRMLREE